MSEIEITRDTNVDDDGTGSTGTVVDEAWVEQLYDRIDALVAQTVQTKAATYTLLVTDDMVVFTAAGCELDLPAASTAGEKTFAIVNAASSGVVTIDPNGPETIDGAASLAVNPSEAYLFKSDGANWYTVAAKGTASNTTVDNGVCEGRLTLTSGTPVTTSDVASASTIYFTPFKGNRIALYDGSAWELHTLSELSLALSGLTSGKNYDVFVYDNAGTLTLELSVAWTNDTTRADALALQDGVYVKSGATTRRHVATFRTISTTETCDIGNGGNAFGTAAKRFVWNRYNRVPRPVYIHESADSWTVTQNGSFQIRQWNNSAVNRLEYVAGDEDTHVKLRHTGLHAVQSAGGGTAGVGIGVDSTSALSGGKYASNSSSTVKTCASAFVHGHFGLGYHYLQLLEVCNSVTDTVFYGDVGAATIMQFGGEGVVWG